MGKGQVYQNHLEVLQTAGSSLTPQLLSHCPKGLAEPPVTYANTYTLVCCCRYAQVGDQYAAANMRRLATSMLLPIRAG